MTRLESVVFLSAALTIVSGARADDTASQGIDQTTVSIDNDILTYGTTFPSVEETTYIDEQSYKKDAIVMPAPYICPILLKIHRGVKMEEVETGTIFLSGTTKQPVSSTEAVVTTTDVPEKNTVPTDDKTDKDAFQNRIDKNGVTGHENDPIADDTLNAKNISIRQNYSRIARYPMIDWSADNSKNNANDETNCTAPFQDYGLQYNWYQILVENGGRPGEVNASRLIPNKTEVLFPCKRPIGITSPENEDLIYEYELVEVGKVFRREEAYLRFAGTPVEFIDVIGKLVWLPPNRGRRYYEVFYRKDDTGFYVDVHVDKHCEFRESPLTVKCDLILCNCDCNEDCEAKIARLGDKCKIKINPNILHQGLSASFEE